LLENFSIYKIQTRAVSLDLRVLFNTNFQQMIFWVETILVKTSSLNSEKAIGGNGAQ
jgi:hypothetical protein